MTTSKQQTNTNSAFNNTTQPGFAPQVGALNTAFGSANTALSQAQTAKAPTDFISQMTPDQLSVFSRMLGTGQAGADTATNMYGAGSNGASAALSGLVGFDPAASNNMNANIAGGMAYAAGADIPGAVRNAMLTATQQARDVTLPGITAGAAGTGNINSNRPALAAGLVERGLGEQAANLGASLYDSFYNNGANLTSNTNTGNNAAILNSLSAALSGGTNLSAGGLDALKGMYNMQTTGAAGPQQQAQLDLNNQLQQFQSGVNSPFAALNNYYNIIGANNWGQNQSGTSSSQSTTTSTPSTMQTIAGALGAASSLLGGKGGALGGGSGLLGMSPSLFGLLA